ncbi:MAG: hypothetical protein ACJATT_004166 [Myxococcota bacterium]|jgi:hypothetical protein
MKWIAIGGLLIAGCVKKPVSTVLAMPADLDEAHLNAVVRELVPLVEAAAGVRFKEVPFVRLGRKSDLDRIVRNEAGATYDALSPDAPDWLRDRFIRDAGSAGVAGKYALTERILLVAPDAMARVASHVDGDPLALDHVTRLVLAHEMAHALQDQQFAIGEQFEHPEHVDAFQALRGVTEGHANFVESKVAEALGLQAVEKVLNQGQGWDEDGPVGVWSFGTWVAYGQGTDFIRWHAAAGGLPRTLEVLADPPMRSRTLFVPEEYGEERGVDPEDERILDGMESAVMEARWFPQTSPLIEQDLRRLLFGAPAPEVESALDHVVGGATRSAARDDRSVLSFYLRCDTEAAASTLIGMHSEFSDGLSKARTMTPSMPNLYTAESVSALGDEAWMVVSASSRDGEASAGPASEIHTLWVRHGSDVVVVQAAGFRPGERLPQAVRLVLGRLDPAE